MGWRERLQLEDEQIEPILARLRHCIQCFEKRCGDLTLACAGEQWGKQKIAIGSAPADMAPHQFEPKHGSAKSASRASTTKGGVYSPGAAKRSFSHVKQLRGSAVRLICSTCQHTVTSDW